MRGVELERLHGSPRDRLASTKPGYPRVQAAQRPCKRLDLPNTAAFPAFGHGIEEAVRAAVGNKLLERPGFRGVGFYADSVASSYVVHHVIGLLVEAACVQKEDPGTRGGFAEHVDKHHVLGTEARCQRDAVAELSDGPLDHVLRRGVRHFRGDSLNVRGRQYRFD